jgi:hypothetical protein
VEAPQITVETPPHPKPIRKWKFEIMKENGRTKEIIATAME